MWKSLNHMVGYRARTSDGTETLIKDFLFDDLHWTVRYMVLDTGQWLQGRQVLISPESFLPAREPGIVLRLNLTKKQVDNSPSISADKPISRQQEQGLTDYFGWTQYWQTPPLAGAGITQNYPNPIPLPPIEERRLATGDREQDPHLRSVGEVSWYRMEAADGDIGRIKDFIVDDQRWMIRFLVGDVHAWLPGGEVLISPHWISRIRWNDRHVKVDLTRDQIRRSPPYDPSEPVNEDLERRLFDYYGRPKPEAPVTGSIPARGSSR